MIFHPVCISTRRYNKLMRKGLLARSWRSGLKIPRDSCSRPGFMRDCAEKCNFPWHGQRGALRTEHARLETAEPGRTETARSTAAACGEKGQRLWGRVGDSDMRSQLTYLRRSRPATLDYGRACPGFLKPPNLAGKKVTTSRSERINYNPSLKYPAAFPPPL
ncbi:MAG: hypothetical protein OD815_001424 [Candidatus Alkanophagales archaeon MCA70_species_2]|nr:hypothetical protein [Candidatus Alkanophaga liquidiphilum]